MSAGVSALTALSMLAIISIPAAATPASANPLARFNGSSRILVVVAPQPDDPKLARQRDLFRAMKAGAEERDLVLVVALGETEQAMALRRRFSLDDRAFHAILVGKDGGGKLTSDDPLGPEALFPLIDSMPMRQKEMLGRR